MGEPACRLSDAVPAFGARAMAWVLFENGKQAAKRQLSTFDNLVKDYPLREWNSGHQDHASVDAVGADQKNLSR